MRQICLNGAAPLTVMVGGAALCLQGVASAGMSFSIQQLRSATDDDLISRHDQQAQNTVVGVDYYLDELRRREQMAAMRSSQRLAKAAVFLGVANTLGALAAVGISVF